MLDEADRARTRGRQLSLFKSKRQRGTVIPSSKEFALHCMVADTVRRWILPGWIWTHFPAGEARTAITGSRLKRMGLNRGFPDFQFFHRDGACCFLELKRKGSRLDEYQDGVASHLKAAGHRHLVTDSFDTAIASLVEWKILRGMKIQ
jgi:hypothetical protein